MTKKSTSQGQADSVFSDNEQEWLKTQFTSIQENHKLMLRSMDRGNVNDAIKYGALIADELRTTMLTPKKYYELCFLIFFFFVSEI
jgi:vacuolar protein sorting-associated protein 35